MAGLERCFLKILVVDDSRTIRCVVSHVLKQLGYHAILEAENGKQGLRIATSMNPDLIITDWNMPFMSGIEMARALRQKGLQTPILMVTANGTANDLVLAREAGVTSFISKPMSHQKLGNTIRSITQYPRSKTGLKTTNSMSPNRSEVGV